MIIRQKKKKKKLYIYIYTPLNANSIGEESKCLSKELMK